MNRSIFWRLVWKEYRLQRAFWLSTAVLTSLLLVMTFTLVLDPKERSASLFAIALMLPALYALGCGATPFAGEHEAETYEFQRSLPVSSIRVFFAKIVFGLTSMAAMVGLMWYLATLLNGQDVSFELKPLWLTLGFFGLEMFVWATFFSLLLKRPLLAALLGAPAALLGDLLITTCVYSSGMPSEVFIDRTTPWRVAAATLMALVDVRMGTHWFGTERIKQLSPGKLLRGLAKTAAVLGLMSLAMYLYLCRLHTFLPYLPPLFLGPAQHEGYALLWWLTPFFALEMLLWAAFFSLLFKRVLPGAILGTVVSLAIVEIMTELAVPLLISQPNVLNRYLLTMPSRLVFAVLLLCANCWLAITRFRESRSQRCLSASSFVFADRDRPERATTLPHRLNKLDRTALLGRLVWQHGRQSVAMMLAAAAIIVLLALFPSDWLVFDWLMQFSSLQMIAHKPFYLGALGLVPLLGICAFLADQRRSGYRFFADRGVPPMYVWLSRLCVSLIPLVVVLPVLLRSAYYLAPLAWIDSRHPVPDAVGILTFVGACVMICWAAGQLCSMFLRSGILAGVFGVLLGTLLTGWCGLMWLWGINWLWSVLPIPIALLLATRLRTQDWLLERNTLRAWLVPGLVLIVPAAALAVAVPLYRIYTVHGTGVMPFVTGLPIPSFLPMQYIRLASPEEQATFNLYERAFQELTHFPARTEEEKKQKQDNLRVLAADEKTWVDENQKVVAMLLDASQKKLSHRWSRKTRLPLQVYFDRLPQLLICSATKLEEEGKLDAALERYLAVVRISAQFRDPTEWYNRYYAMERDVYARLPLWATCPNQTPERITGAIRQLEQLCSKLPAGGDRIRDDYGNMELFLSGDPLSIAVSEYNGEPLPPLTVLWLHLPWERERAMRILNVLTNEKLDVFTEAEYAGQHNKIIQRPRWQHEYNYDYLLREHAEWPYALCKAISVPPISYGPYQPETEILNEYIATETSRRAVRLILACEAWKLQHGALPEALDELVGPYFEELPVDPYSGEPFRYFRDGLKISLRWRQLPVAWGGEIPADSPFIWSIGNSIELEPLAEKLLARYRIIQPSHYSPWRRDASSPRSEYDLWLAGWPFPIP